MTDIVIYANDTIVGAAQMCEITDDTGNPEGWCGRVRLDKKRLSEIFMRGFVHPKAQKLPFQKIEYDGITINNVWVKSNGFVYIVDNFIIIDQMFWVAEDIK
jgi:hypothetical protein